MSRILMDIALTTAGDLALSAAGDLVVLEPNTTVSQQILLAFFQRTGGLPWAPYVGTPWATTGLQRPKTYESAQQCAMHLAAVANAHPLVQKGTVQTGVNPKTNVVSVSYLTRWGTRPVVVLAQS